MTEVFTNSSAVIDASLAADPPPPIVVMLAVSSVAHKRFPSIIKPAYLAYDQTKPLSQSQQC